VAGLVPAIKALLRTNAKTDDNEVAGVADALVDEDWAAKIARQDALFTQDDSNLTWRQVAPLGNGMIGTAPGSPLIHLQGVVSNNTRAYVPSSLPSVTLSSPHMQMTGALLDMREATYLRRYGAANGCNVSLEQRWFAHRSRPSLFVLEVEALIPCGCPRQSPLAVAVSHAYATTAGGYPEKPG
jgi:hypothetical protein